MRRVLIAVDFQEGFHVEDTEGAISNVSKLLDAGVFDVVIATAFVNNEDSMFYKMLGWHGMRYGDPINIVSSVRSHASYILEKDTYSGVDDVLSFCLGLDGPVEECEIYVCGLDTDACVLATLFQLFDNGLQFKVITDCCASSGGSEFHESALKIIERNFGINCCVTMSDLLG